MADDQQRLVATIEARFAKFEKDMQRVVGTAEKRMRQVERGISGAMERAERSTARAVSGMERNLSRVGKAMMIGGGVGGTALISRQIARLADDWTRAGNKIAAAGIPTDKVEGQLQVLADLANRSRSGINETVDLYARLSRAGDQLGMSQEQLLRITETVNKAIKAGGGSSTEAASTVLQLGQALGSGVLQGDELRAIRENSPILAQAIADEFGTTIGGLKKLGEEGELVSERVAKAILNASGVIDDAFGKTKMTISDAGTVFWNEMTRFIAAADDAAGVSDKLVAVFSAVARNVDLLGAAITTLATIFIGRLVVRGLKDANKALGDFSRLATRAAVDMMWVGNAGSIAGGRIKFMGQALLSAFGGQVGALITGVGVAIGLYTASLDDAMQSAAEYDAATSQIIGGLELVARMQDEAAKSAKALAGDIAEAGKAQEDAKKVSEALAKARREEAIATLSAAQAAAYLRMQNAQGRAQETRDQVSAIDSFLGGRVAIGPEQERAFADAKRRRDEAESGLSQIEAEAKNAEEAATLMWNALQKLLSGDLTAPDPATGRGAAGGIREISKELQKLMELEKKRRNWRSNPEERFDARQSLEDASDRATTGMEGMGHLAGLMKAEGRRAPMVLEAQQSWREAFRGFIYDLRSGDILGAFENLFDSVTQRMMDRASDYLADMLFDAIGSDTMTELFGPAEASQAALASATSSAATAQIANTAALNVATSALYNMAAAAGAGGGGSGGWLNSIIGSLIGGNGIAGAGSGSAGAGIAGVIGRRAGGGPVGAGRSYIVGEHGPELVRFNRAGTVIPARATANILNRANEASQNSGGFVYAPVVNAPGADAAALARLEMVVRQQAAELRSYMANEPYRIRATVREAGERRALRG